MASLTPAQATTYAQAAGFTGSALDTIVAIAQAESGLNPLAVNINTDSHTFPDGHTGPSEDRGVLQINNFWWPQVSDAMAFDPATAFVWGYTISKQGTDFTPWSTYSSGAYRRYLPMTTPAPISRMLPNALHFSEFQSGYHGTCGETALATALVCASPPIETAPQAIALMLSMTREMISLGWAASSGATTTQRLHDEAIRRGFTVDAGSFVSYKEPLDATSLHSLLLSTAGVKPVVLEIARASNLPGDEAGVQYHFICVVGITPQGYVCNDGDNASITQHLVTYSWSELLAARPCGVMVVDMQKGANTMGIPTGWKDDGKLLTAPNGQTVGTGFRDYILAHPWDAANVPVGPERHEALVEYCNPSHGAGTVQYFQQSQLTWTQAGGVWETRIGLEAAALRQQVDTLSAQLVAAKSQPQPAPVPLDPSIPNTLSAALQALQPFANLAADIRQAISRLPK